MPRLPYALLYIENGDVIATCAGLTEAQAKLDAFVAEHPKLQDEVAILKVDPSGRMVGEYRFANRGQREYA